MAWFAVAVGAATVLNGLKQADQIRSQAQLTEQLNEVNAKYADVDANNAKIFGYTQVARYQETIDQTVSGQRSALASENVDVNYGTGAAIQADAKVSGFLNQLDLQAQARAKALGYQREARNIRQGGQVQLAQAEIDANGAATRGALDGARIGLSGYNKSGGGKADGTLTVGDSNADVSGTV